MCLQYLNFSPTGACGIDVGCVGRFGSFSCLLYILLKVANTFNVIVQLHIINTFVGDGSLMWGVEVIRSRFDAFPSTQINLEVESHLDVEGL